MVGDVPVLKPREVVTILERLGFAQARQKGSRRQYRHPDGRATTVLSTSGATFPPCCCARSRRTSASPSVSSSNTGRLAHDGVGECDDEVDAAVTALTTTLEPIMIVVMGVVIGGLVVAMYLPMFDLLKSVQR